jgi:hypothetical protein
MIDSMGSAARRLVRSRLATFLVCAGGVLLSVPSAGLAAGWTANPETVTAQNGVTGVSTGLDGSSNLIAVWAGGNGIQASVRSATTKSWATPVVLSGSDTDVSGPDVAVASDGKAVATWIGPSKTIWGSVRQNGSWSGPAELSDTTDASSAQAEIVGGIATAFWIDGTVIERATTTQGGLWTTHGGATPTGAPGGPGVLSDLRVALASDGSGVAAWLRTDGNTVTVETAVIDVSGTWTVSAAPLSTTADDTSTVAVAAGSAVSAVAWSEPGTGVRVAVYDGTTFAVESGATIAGAELPSLAVDSTGRLVATALDSGALSAEFRSTVGDWAAPAPLASGAVSTNVSSDSVGDVVVAWPTASDVQIRVFDATKPVLTLTTPGASVPPGDHTWSVSSFDIWSAAPASSADWSFSPGGTQQNTASAVDSEQIPGPVTGTVTVTDAANNTATAQATITIQSVGPVNNQLPVIGGGSAPVDGGTLTVQSAGAWTGNPTPSVASVWQRCDSGQICQSVTANPDGSYTLKAADVGKRMRIEESANNSGGTVVAHSAETPVVKPISTFAPSLTPSAPTIADGVLLTASSGTWDSADGLTFTYAFQSCDATCSTVQTGASNTYTPGPGVVGTNIQVQVTATAGPVDTLTAQATATSAQVGVVAPQATAAPGLTGGTQDTQTLTATSPDSSWHGATGLDRTFVFSRCTADGSSCSTAQNGSSSSYQLHAADIGSRIKVTVGASASDSASHASAQVMSTPSALTTVVTPHFQTSSHVGAPIPSAPATLVQDGVTLQATSGTWDDQDALTFSYQYFQCISAPSNCTPVGAPNATGSYLLQPTDVGLAMVVVVTASANGASTSVTSDATVPVQPLNDGNASIAVPAVQQDKQQFTSSDGSWHGATGLTYAYQWKRCDVAQTCTAIPGATSKSYTAVVADVGNTLRVTVSASKGGSAVTPSAGDSSPTAAIAPFPTAAPTLAGAFADTKPLTATDGAWNGATGLTETYQFSRCDVSGNNCNTVQNTGSNVYNLVLADIGSTIRVTVFAKKNSSASIASAASSFTSVIAPLSTAAPAAPTGQTQDGVQLTALDGTWADQSGLSFRYQWYRCAPTCSPLAGATAKTYKLQAADVGAKLYADTTAFVGAGAATTSSPQTLAVAPLSTVASSISTPTAQDGQLFSASTGEWDGAAGLTYVYKWNRCDLNGANCALISNTASTYTAGAADVGFTLEATVSASKGGSALTPSPFSQPTAVIAPRNTVRPTISGDPTDGKTLTTPTSTNAAWNNTSAILVFAYQWLRCDAAGANCLAIDGATNATYTLTADDVTAANDPTHARHKVEVKVTATVNGATTPITSDVTGTIAAQTTTVTTLPNVTGGAYSNQTLNVGAGTWTGTGISYQSYQWVRCDPPLANPACTNLGPAALTATNYLVQGTDVGHYVTVIETVVNRLGETKSVRAAFGVPVLQNQFGIADGGPVVSGSYVDGQTLTATSGTWTQPDGVVFSYSWRRCAPNANGSAPGGSSTCPFIPHATSPSYTLTPDDVGKYVVVRVKGEYAPASANASFDSDIEGLSAVAAAPPVNTGRPTISGAAAKQDVLLTASAGTWNGTNTAAIPMTFAYQWSRCNVDGTTCQPIAGATAASYAPTATDVGLRLLVKVTATNSGGSQSTVSNATDVVATSAVPSAGGGAPAAGGGGAGAGSTPIRATSTKTDKTAPILTLAFLGGGKLLSGTTLQVNATCPKTETSCKAKFQLVATLKKPTGKAVSKPVVIASATATLNGGQKKLLKLKLSSAARTALKKSLTLKVTLMANVVDASGNVTPKETKGITLRWKKA